MTNQHEDDAQESMNEGRGLCRVLSVGVSLAGWRGRFDEQFEAASSRWTPAELNPIAWYKGDGDATDAMGNYDGTWAGTEAYADGPTGQAFDFNGSSQIGLGANFNFAGDASFSVSFWLEAERKASEEFIVSHLGHEINKRAWKITKFNQFLVFDTYSNGMGDPRNTIYATISFESRRHVTVSVDGLYARIYIDGVLANGDVALPRYDTRGLVVTKIGAAGSSLAVNALMLEGKLDDVLIFDRALTPEEVELLYTKSMAQNGAEWGQPPPPWTPAVLNPVAWYQGEGNAKDSSGNGYDGTWAGPALYTLAEIDTSTPRTSTEISNDIQRVQGKAILLQGLNAVVADTRSNIAETVVLGDAEVAGLYLQQMKKPVPPLLEQAPTNTVEYIVGAGMRQDLGAE